MAVSLHAFATLVLVDFGLPLLFEGSHSKNSLSFPVRTDPWTTAQLSLNSGGRGVWINRPLYSRGIR